MNAPEAGDSSLTSPDQPDSPSDDSIDEIDSADDLEVAESADDLEEAEVAPTPDATANPEDFEPAPDAAPEAHPCGVVVADAIDAAISWPEPAPTAKPRTPAPAVKTKPSKTKPRPIEKQAVQPPEPRTVKAICVGGCGARYLLPENWRGESDLRCGVCGKPGEILPEGAEFPEPLPIRRAAPKSAAAPGALPRSAPPGAALKKPTRPGAAGAKTPAATGADDDFSKLEAEAMRQLDNEENGDKPPTG